MRNKKTLEKEVWKYGKERKRIDRIETFGSQTVSWLQVRH
jgi:hypothetical protein